MAARSTWIGPEEGAVEAAIGLGGNLGDSRALLTGALAALAEAPGLRLRAVSPWYRTAPVGPPQPDYLNGCALVTTTLPAEALLELLLATEARFGRVRRERWGPRRLDLDLLFHGSHVIETPHLRVPHPLLAERGFVLVPLADVAPRWRHPLLGQSVVELLEAWRHRPPDGRVGSSTIEESPPHAQPLLRRFASPGD
ncbi:MAG: 2-amino-4-hydroxy-6-hydroxymethyldihydropteridine diphosphokinase [Cyanobacteriota bacterium]|nr:2-amino-4-hydroxy-6-hydroxymethyldihydropteridine diphosphokinase [Cyanobacteriota bacterium]